MLTTILHSLAKLAEAAEALRLGIASDAEVSLLIQHDGTCVDALLPRGVTVDDATAEWLFTLKSRRIDRVGDTRTLRASLGDVVLVVRERGVTVAAGAVAAK